MNLLVWFLLFTTLVASLAALLAFLGLLRLRRRVVRLQADYAAQLETVLRLQSAVREVSGRGFAGDAPPRGAQMPVERSHREPLAGSVTRR